MSAFDEEVVAARESIDEKERTWLRSLERCSCPRPLIDRVYLGWIQCRACGLLTGLRSRRARP